MRPKGTAAELERRRRRAVEAARAGLYFAVLPDNQKAHGTEVVTFLSWRCARLPGAWTGVWDRHPIPRGSRVVGAWLARLPRLRQFSLPPGASLR